MNYLQVHRCISEIVQPVTPEECRTFIINCVTYTYEYPYEFFTRLEQFSKDIYHFSVENDDQTMTIVSTAESCSYCPNKKINWFKFFTPKWATDATYYDCHQIGI